MISDHTASIYKMHGDDPSQSPGLARMIREHDAERVASYIIPEKVIIGGWYNIKARYVEPTILNPSSWEDRQCTRKYSGNLAFL